MPKLLVFEIKLRKERPMTRGMWLKVFDQLLNALMEKKFPEATVGGRYFFGNSEGARGLTLLCENGKS